MKLRTHTFIDEHFPDAWLNEDCILYINQDGHAFAVKGFEVHGQPMSNLSQSHLASWRTAAQAMLNALEIHTHLSFYWTPENDFSRFIEGHHQGADPSAPFLARHLLDERLKNYREQQLANELCHRKLYVFVNFQPQASKLRNDESFRRGIKASECHRLLLSEWKAARKKLDQLTNLVRSPFTASGMNTTNLGHAAIRRIFRKILAPHRVRLRASEPQGNGEGHLWSETLLSDIERRPPFLYFDEHYHAFISINNLPSDTKTGFLQHLFSLSHPDYALSFTFRTTDKQAEIKKLQSDFGSKMGLQRSRERRGKIVNVEMEAQAEEIRQDIRTLTHTPQQLFCVQPMIHLWHFDPEGLRPRVDEAILKAGYCKGMQAVLETIAAPEALRACFPGWTREERLDRFHLVKSVNAADLIPNHTDFIGTGIPQLLFSTPEGGLTTAHVFTASRPFHNVVVGETGGGKTFSICSLVTQLVAQGLKSVTVISTKDEFGPLMAINQGEKISFQDGHPVFLNPCAIMGDKPTQTELVAITAILETIFGDEPNDAERKIRESRILKVIGSSFAKQGANTRLHHLVDEFRAGWEHDKHDDLERLAMILEPYARGGVYGEYFDSETRKPLDLSNNFKFFDFSRIEENKNLSAVMMMALTKAEAIRLARLPRHHRKALLLDECWAFVDSAAGGGFIERALRVYRAFNCAVFLSTQVLTDLLGPRMAPVVRTNCHNFFILRVKDRKLIGVIQEVLELTHELVSRLPAMPDPSEAEQSHFIYVHRSGSQQIAGECVLKIGKAEALLYSTSPNVSQLRDHYIRNAPDPWEAVCRLSAMTPEQISAENTRLFTPTTIQERKS